MLCSLEPVTRLYSHSKSLSLSIFPPSSQDRALLSQAAGFSLAVLPL